MTEVKEFKENLKEKIFSEDEDFQYTSSEEENLEKDYFGEEEEESESEEGVWEDSESGEDSLRDKHKTVPAWINDKKPKKVLEIKKKKLIYRFDRYQFKTNFNIKILKKIEKFVVVVDTMNNVYLLQEKKVIKSFKIERFRVDDVVGFNNKIYLINGKCGFLKEIDEDLEIDNVEKKITRNMRKGYSFGNEEVHDESGLDNPFLYILGDTTVVLNKNLNCLSEFHDKFLSLEKFNNKIVALSSSGDVLLLSQDLKLEKKLVFDEGSSFTDLYSSENHLVINSLNSILFLDSNFRIVKDVLHLKNPVKNIVHLHDHFFCFSSAKGGLKILDKNLNFNNTFPKKKIRLPEISKIVKDSEGIYLSSHRDLHYLKIEYKN
ncbi:ornithine decarboxylase [Nosema bombycis CQ1]|uniref:Ornithine decarboxylase n=1 Tax=Nosema bombycis (strain CQ1 / CVCC 102059) TaxID=578461 RepID=R0KPB4_NOSB1|nr:ornithine decarboxylase [Nosema bombycis CQ1]|eukprot:EOB12541.1 ornithine decarboxylase [Nosema bombycis CQ1]